MVGKPVLPVVAIPATLNGLLEQFNGRGEAEAIVALDGRRIAISFSELFRRAGLVAAELASRGLEDGTVVGLIAPNAPGWIEAFWGIVAAANVPMPVDPQISMEDLKRMLSISNCRLLLASGLRERLQNDTLPCEVVDLELFVEAVLKSRRTDIVNRNTHSVDQNATAVLLFTSGTTGFPKAVPLTHRNLLSNVEAIVSEGIISSKDCALVPLPLHHAYPLTVGMLSVLAVGAKLVLPGGISGPPLINAIRQEHVTAILGVPRLYQVLVENIRRELTSRFPLIAKAFYPLTAVSNSIRRDLGVPLGRWAFQPLRALVGPSLRILVSGGAALPVKIEKALNGLGWQVLTGYGLTETSPILAFDRPGRARIGSVGQALPGVHLRIANPDPEGVGEIEASGASVFRGYKGETSASSAAFTTDGWFRTGDLGRLDARGYLFITARATETIVLPNGEKIYPEVIEALYTQNEPLIREMAVFWHSDGLVALIVPNEEVLRASGTLRLEGRIHDALALRARGLGSYQRLAGFAITRQALPRSQLGKIRRHLIPELYRGVRQRKETPRESPVTGADADLLCNKLAAALLQWIRARYPNQAIDLETSPQLDLGVDSLGWTDLSLALQQELGISLTDQQIARVITMRDLLREAIATAPQAGIRKSDATEQQQVWLEAYPLWLHALRAIGEALIRLVMRYVFHLRVEGLSKLPEPPFLVCPNHVSYLDAFALGAALPHKQLRSTYFAGWTTVLFSTRLRRLFSRAAQVIPVDPDHAAAAAIALGAAVLAGGRTLVLFAEGELSPSGALQPFQTGVGAVLERNPVWVVPVYLKGTAAALPPGKLCPRPRPVTVCFGDPIDPARSILGGPSRAHQQQITHAIQAAVEALIQ